MKTNLRSTLLEESKSPTQYAEEIGSYWSRISKALLKAKYVMPSTKNRMDGYDMLMQAYSCAGKTIVNLVVFPDTTDLDIRIIRNPDIVPEAVFSKFSSKDGGKTWVRFQTRFKFDNADAVRRVATSFQDRVFKAIESFRDDEKICTILDPESTTKTMKTVDKRTPKIVTGSRN